MGCIWQEQHSWDYMTWRGIKAFTVNTTEQAGMLWLENSRCSLSLPLSRALLLFQLGFGASWPYFLLLPDDSWQMPSFLPSAPVTAQEVGWQQEGCPLHRVSTVTPLSQRNQTQTSPAAPQCCWAKAENKESQNILGWKGPTSIIMSNTWG